MYWKCFVFTGQLLLQIQLSVYRQELNMISVKESALYPAVTELRGVVDCTEYNDTCTLSQPVGPSPLRQFSRLYNVVLPMSVTREPIVESLSTLKINVRYVYHSVARELCTNNVIFYNSLVLGGSIWYCTYYYGRVRLGSSGLGRLIHLRRS